jgi:pimeloyl-ACP methyl ester carboxylesterase
MSAAETPALAERFRIATAESDLRYLKKRLAHTQWPSDAPVEGWVQGTNRRYLMDLVAYWCERFDWRLQESRLNELSHFRAPVEGLRLHFIHEKGKGPNPIPLVLIHGWPSSFTEMLKVIPLLTDPVAHGGRADDSFDVVVPSLPGYGYSDAWTQPGMSIWRTANLIYELMHDVLGYSRFFVSGGDWGAYAATYIGYRYPAAIPAIHLSFVPGNISPQASTTAAPLSAAESALLARRRWWNENEGGYEHLQCTKPQTLAYALTDSPVGLAAWILEKMYSWSDCKGDIESVFSKDELLTNISVYWFTRTIASSARMYYETAANPWSLPPGARIETPTAIAVFPKELSVPPREWAERLYNVQRWTEMPKGGHFAAAEQPELLVNDIRAFFRAVSVKVQRRLITSRFV